MPTPQGIAAVTAAIVTTAITLITLLLVTRQEKEHQRNR